MKKTTEKSRDPKLDLVGLCCQAIDDKKGEDIRILDVSHLSSITDYLVIATGNSQPHLQALSQEVAAVLKQQKHPLIGKEMNPQSGWTVVDAHDVIIHLFLPDMRDLYRLDSLWKDGKAMDPAQFITPTETVAQQRGH